LIERDQSANSLIFQAFTNWQWRPARVRALR
jgi:hypothetical protein